MENRLLNVEYDVEQMNRIKKTQMKIKSIKPLIKNR